MVIELVPAEIEAKLAQRLHAVSDVLLDGPSLAMPGPPPQVAGTLLDRLVRAVQSDLSPDTLWLLCCAVFGAYPTPDDLITGIRFFELAPPTEAVLWLLDRGVNSGPDGWALGDIEVVSDRVVVDVHYSARYDLHTGIQQMARRTLPIWGRDHAVLPVAWTDNGAACRTLLSSERRRLLHRGTPSGSEQAEESAPLMVVPWRTAVVLVEAPPSDACARLAALARYSGNALLAVGHDCIPVVSGDLVPPAEPQKFSRYLTALKYARRIAGVSYSAAREFEGFASAVAAQGLGGPAVVVCPEPTEFADPPEPVTDLTSGDTAPRVPLVLSVGSLEPRKNHLALLYAAERLWREDLRFRMLLIASSRWGEEVPEKVRELRARGRPVTIQWEPTDSALASAYRTARFTMLASLHEGYGLPVVESMAFGTPVITTDYGSTAEIASGGGALLVDPRDDEAIVDAMRRLLTDDDLLEVLRRQIQARPVRTWERYAAELWECLVQPELDNVERESGR